MDRDTEGFGVALKGEFRPTVPIMFRKLTSTLGILIHGLFEAYARIPTNAPEAAYINSFLTVQVTIQCCTALVHHCVSTDSYVAECFARFCIAPREQ